MNFNVIILDGEDFSDNHSENSMTYIASGSCAGLIVVVAFGGILAWKKKTYPKSTNISKQGIYY